MNIAGREILIEHRGSYGWFIMERGQTLFGFQTKGLLTKYLSRVRQENRWHTPTARECYR